MAFLTRHFGSEAAHYVFSTPLARSYPGVDPAKVTHSTPLLPPLKMPLVFFTLMRSSASRSYGKLSTPSGASHWQGRCIGYRACSECAPIPPVSIPVSIPASIPSIPSGASHWQGRCIGYRTCSKCAPIPPVFIPVSIPASIPSIPSGASHWQGRCIGYRACSKCAPIPPVLIPVSIPLSLYPLYLREPHTGGGGASDTERVQSVDVLSAHPPACALPRRRQARFKAALAQGDHHRPASAGGAFTIVVVVLCGRRRGLVNTEVGGGGSVCLVEDSRRCPTRSISVPAPPPIPS
eukprot:1177850-Prorocentrum_minimum.AAC.1